MSTRKPNLVWREELYALVPRGGSCCELGVQWGYNAAAIQYVAAPRELVLVDAWRHFPGAYEQDGSNVSDEQQERIFRFVTAHAVWPGTSIVRATTHEAAGRFTDGQFDLVYLDACHLLEDVRRDLADWWPKVKPGGLFCGHDYWQVNVPYIRVAQAVDEFCARLGRELDYISDGHCGSWGLWKN